MLSLTRIDGNPQSNLSSKLDLLHEEDTLIDIFEYEDIEPSTVIRQTHIHNVAAICTNINMTKTEIKLVSVWGKELILENFLEDNKDFFEESYDFILIDTNPSFSIINQNIFLASDAIILVNDPSLDSLNGSKMFMQLLGQVLKRLKRENNIKGFLVNQYMKRRNIFEDFVEYCSKDEVIGELIFKTFIPHTVKFAEASVKFYEFVEELMERV